MGRLAMLAACQQVLVFVVMVTLSAHVVNAQCELVSNILFT